MREEVVSFFHLFSFFYPAYYTYSMSVIIQNISHTVYMRYYVMLSIARTRERTNQTKKKPYSNIATVYLVSYVVYTFMYHLYLINLSYIFCSMIVIYLVYIY